ncbi:MAG: P1 family peptidase [Woeseiaceae bacterium]
MNNCLIVLAALLFAHGAAADAIRARDLGIPFDGVPGSLNAITDVAGVTVGHVTIINDLSNNHAVRTGVTAIIPRGRDSLNKPAFAGWFTLNGNGEMTGTTWVEESGFLEGPVMLTNTHSVGTVHQATIEWRIAQGAPDSTGYYWSAPVVAETWDGDLNDINGFHVKPEHVFEALDSASAGPVAEGSVGGGTGMICHEFKCGIGTSSRIARTADGSYTVGVLVQANYGWRETLRVAGVPVGKYLRTNRASSKISETPSGGGSIIIVAATDAPLLPHQLKRVAKRTALGLARVGSFASNASGDIFIAFSTANTDADQSARGVSVRVLANDDISPLFLATVEATEEAIVNALVAGRDMTGDRGYSVQGIDHDALVRVLREHNRYVGD